jgi:hypothetical protein
MSTSAKRIDLPAPHGAYFTRDGAPTALGQVLIFAVRGLIDRLGGQVWAWVPFPCCTLADLPTNAPIGALCYCTDESGGAQHVAYDGAAWRRLTDRAVAS